MGAAKVIVESFLYCRVSAELKELPTLLRVISASRLCVIPMTLYAVVLGGLMAWLDNYFNWLIFLGILFGFIFAHIADNLLNDLTDVKKGIDEPGYFRNLYGPHPVIDGIVSESEVKTLISIILSLDFLLAVYLGIKVSLLIPLLALIGVGIMGLYGGFPIDAKKYGIGELLVAIVWGPIIIGGTYLALTKSFGLKQTLIYVPYAIAVSLVLIGKHLDKFDYDIKKGLRTLPIRLGKGTARKLAFLLALASFISMILGIYFYTNSLWSFIMSILLPNVTLISLMLKIEKPVTSPENWPVWPLWYAAWSFALLDLLGRYSILTLVLIKLSNYWKYSILTFIILMWLFDFKRLKTMLKFTNYIKVKIV